MVLTAAEVADRYKVHVNTVYAMAKDGRLPHGGTGRRLRFEAKDCDRVFLGTQEDKHEMDR